MKNIVNLLLFLFVFLSACSDDSILEELKPEPPKSDVEEPKPDDDSENKPVLTWRAHANNLYTNWLNYYVYQVTPYDLYGTPF